MLRKKLQAQLALLEGSLEENFLLIIYFCCAQFYLEVQDFKNALKWINIFLNLPKTNLRADLQCSARLINLIIHYELGNYELVDYSLKSTYRFIFKRDRMYKVERLVLRSIKQLAQVGRGEEADLIFRKMQQELDVMVTSSSVDVNATKHGFDFLSGILVILQ